MRVLELKAVSDDRKWVVSTVALAAPEVRIIDSLLNPEYLSDTFETMVFPASETGEIADFTDHYRCGYTEITEAEIGHGITLAQLNAGNLKMYDTD